MPATALDLPPELIRRIADELVNSSVVGIEAVDETDTLWSIKDIISQCSLTCRYWSQIFRPYLFWEITLRSLADLEELAVMINSPRNTSIREHIHVLRVDHRETSVPWLHRVAMLRLELPRCERATLQIESPLQGTSIRTFTTLHPLLPSTAPASYSSFTSLTISSHHFGNFNELLKLIRGLDLLQDLTCSGITWGARTPIRATERGVRLSKTLKDVSAISCQEHWPQLWLLTVTKAAATAGLPSPLLSVPEMTTIAEIIEVLLLCGRTPDEPQAYLQFATSMHVVAPEPNGPNNWALVFRSTLSSPALLARFTLLPGIPFSFVSHFALDMKLSKGAPTISSLSEYNPKSVLFDEENQDPLKTLAAFPMRTPSEEVLAIEWEQLALLVGKMAGVGAVRIGVDATTKLTGEEWKQVREIVSVRLRGIGRPCKVELSATNLVVA